MSNAPDFTVLLDRADGRAGLRPLLEALGFTAHLEPVPREAWRAFGLDGEALRDLVLAGRAGSLDALLLEVDHPDVAPRLARRVRARDPARLLFFLVAGPGYDRLTLGAFGLDDGFRHLSIERRHPRASDLTALEEMVPSDGEVGLSLAVRLVRGLDRSGITRRFFADFRARRGAVAEAWRGLPQRAGHERAQLALLFLSRLTFLYFLQRRGVLAGDRRYFTRLIGEWAARHDADDTPRDGGPSLFRTRMQPLFFAVLNRPPEDRGVQARALGELPYLNGGLFEPSALERRYPSLDLPDEEVVACFDDLLERYRFNVGESGDGGHGVDPEILGRVFEGLMAPDRRGDTGSFYTPAPVVDRVIREAIATYTTGRFGEAVGRAVAEGRSGELSPESRYRVRRSLERVRVLDPACGSGAFLLGALERLTRAIEEVSDTPPLDIRRGLVGRALHGVDLLDDATLLCSLRLWLALSIDERAVRPLPNLDSRIRQGDALIDPLEPGALEVALAGDGSRHPLTDPGLRSALRAVGPAARRYLESQPGDRERRRADLHEAEMRVARRWLGVTTGFQRARIRRLRARAHDLDLFGDRTRDAVRAAGALRGAEDRLAELEAAARELDEKGALPFFSFGVHFAEAAVGFDLIVSNPPWVRAHRWPDRLRRLCHRFEVCSDPAWQGAAELTDAPAAAGAQVDLSLLFLERAIRLLAPGGVLAILLPAKALRALYAGAARRMIFRELDLVLLEDHSLDQRSIFRADAFAAVLVGRKGGGPVPPRTPDDRLLGRSAPSPQSPGPPSPVRVRMVRRGVEPLDFELDPADLPLVAGDERSPWVLAPQGVRSVLRAMAETGPPLGRHPGLRVRRGVMTGANDILLLHHAQPVLGGLARIESEGGRRARRQGQGHAARRYRAVVETCALRPVVRGANIDAYSWGTDSYTVWCRDGSGHHIPAPPRLDRYLERHRPRLEERSGWRPGLPLGAVFRVAPETLGPKVAWHDLSDTLRAVALPATMAWAGVERELVPLNTVYFLPVRDRSRALLLAGILNSLPVRVAARSMAERAKDARFRFFAWTVSAVPLPVGWADHAAVTEIRRISRAAHDAAGIDPRSQVSLDRAVAALYGLDGSHLDSLATFDRWLAGRP